ncbi:MAG: hypothetical protein V3S14_00645 [Anaerolineae bacterium]
MKRTTLWTGLLALSLLLPMEGVAHAQGGTVTVTLSVEGMT